MGEYNKHMKKKPHVGIALSGGAALGLAHLGVLHSLKDHGISLSSIAGTSAGSIAAACHAFAVPEEKITEKINELSWRAITKVSPSRFGFFSNEKLGEILESIFGRPNIEDASIPLAIVAVDISTGEKVVFRKGSLIPALLASSAVPAIFSPVSFDGRMLLDGGLLELLPVSELDDMGAEIKIGVNVMKKYSHTPPRNWFDIVDKSNQLLYRAQFDTLAKDAIYIEPNLDAFTGSDFTKYRELISEGYRATTLKIDEIQKRMSGKSSPLQKIFKWIKP